MTIKKIIKNNFVMLLPISILSIYLDKNLNIRFVFYLFLFNCFMEILQKENFINKNKITFILFFILFIIQCFVNVIMFISFDLFKNYENNSFIIILLLITLLPLYFNTNSKITDKNLK